MVNYKDKKISILGIGKSGIACANLLDSLGAKVLISDVKDKNTLKNNINKISPGIKIETGGHSKNILNADLIIPSPGIDTNFSLIEEAGKKNIPLLSEIEIAFSLVNPKLIIAITGTNGKSTVTTLIGEIFKKAGKDVLVGGNIGTPFSDLVNKVNKNTVLVLEISSFQLERIKTFKPDIGIILNITPDHLERHKNMDVYAGIKADLFKNQTARDFCILNADDRYCAEIAKRIKSQIIFFSRQKQLKKGVFIKEEKIFLGLNSIFYDYLPLCVSNIKLPGPHNLENVLAVSASAIVAGINPEIIAEVLENFYGLEHRLEFVREINAIKFINDSKSTNVFSTLVAIKSFSSGMVLIMGGKDKGNGYFPLKKLIKEKIKLLIVLGEASDLIMEQLSGTTKIIKVPGVRQAVEVAYKNSSRESIVLFSPGCSSYDQFKNFRERGQFFKSEVGKIKI
ncbi:UDP-N-acetylmuramoyl-L-alanine--D-glutamate ligase [bacterium]|nr:UDP-N-acetylmuramoyl-L-alanine--D-glutamate ligase [bacterium]